MATTGTFDENFDPVGLAPLIGLLLRLTITTEGDSLNGDSTIDHIGVLQGISVNKDVMEEDLCFYFHGESYSVELGGTYTVAVV